MKCPKCGKTIENDSDYCPFCGCKISDENKTKKETNPKFKENDLTGKDYEDTQKTTSIPTRVDYNPDGMTTHNEVQRETYNGPTETNTFAIVGFILSFFGGVLGIIFSAIALSQIKKNPHQQGHGLALAGLIIGIVILLVEFIYFIVYLAIFMSL